MSSSNQRHDLPVNSEWDIALHDHLRQLNVASLPIEEVPEELIKEAEAEADKVAKR